MCSALFRALYHDQKQTLQRVPLCLGEYNSAAEPHFWSSWVLKLISAGGFSVVLVLSLNGA
jgi:hypothetical protein